MKGRCSRSSRRLGVLVGAASLEVASGGPEAGLQPGTWIGTGTLQGSIDAGPSVTAIAGPVRFTLRVDQNRRVLGQGSWKLRTLESRHPGYGSVDARVKGWAALAFSGTARSISLSGVQYVIGELTGPGLQMPIRVENQLQGRLAMRRADPCKVAGTTQLTAGVTIRWNATQRSGACAA